ncbi:MAG: IS66 family transposase [Pyrinomonadaceae bacterium]
MPWQIYQAYLRGPHALFRLFEDAFGRLALYGQPEPDEQQREIDNLSEHITCLKAQIERLQEENRQLHYRNFQLQRRNAELEGQINKDSHNSSRPPSTDPAWKKRHQSLRRPSGRKPGGQAGHQGSTLRPSAHPSRVVEHRPQQCRRCHSSLVEAEVVRHLRQQVWEVVPAKLKVTEHRLALLRCRSCGQTTKGEFSEAVRSGAQYGPGVKARVLYLQQYQLLPYARTAEAMRDLFGCQLSAGTVVNIVRECSAALVETELKIKKSLRRAGVIHSDETGLRVAKRGHYIHVASTASLTHYAADSRRGRAAMDEIGILPKYRGTLVHDGWWSYDYYTHCRHSLCGAHLLRELTFLAELTAEQKAWAEPLKELLLEIKSSVERARETGSKSLGTQEQEAFSQRYDELLKHGLLLHGTQVAQATPPSQQEPEQGAQRGTWNKQARNLLLRMQQKKAEVLRFMTDFNVPFDNNQAERDIRMVKLQQKVSGCFRSEEGARQFCRIRGYISTMRKQRQGVLEALDRACRGEPLSLSRRAG